jgi:hypothetical protein
MGVSTVDVTAKHQAFELERKKGGGHYNNDPRRKMVVFWNSDDDQPYSKDSMGFRCYGIPLDVWKDLGKPDFVTLTVEAR